MKSLFHYHLSQGKHGEVRLFLSKAEATELYRKLGVALTAKRARGHRTYHVSLAHKGRIWSKLHVTSHAAHKRHCATTHPLPSDGYPWRG
jgi:hypothetical protein